MRMHWQLVGSVTAAIVITVPAQAKVYLSVEEAQKALFPGVTMTAAPVQLSDEQKNKIEQASGVTVRNRELRLWRAGDDGFFILDEVLGKHEYITYAVALTKDGAVRGVEILEYRESYGFEIRDAGWRQQLVGKTSAAPLKLNKDIKNISGATLSCRHITDGVKRLLATFDAAIK
jgi:Na+-translocating ferredoxin:NAD+ oxidoreductase RnfG subunit